jgi:PST family polysaccharide transporter
MASLNKNIFNLGIVQIFQYIIPLLQLPYLARVLGVDLFGMFLFSLSLVHAVNVIGDFGLSVYLPQRIARHAKRRIRINQLISSTIFLKIVLSFVSLAIYILLSSFNENFSEHKIYFFIMCLTLIGYIFLPMWLFQGLENVKSFVVISIVSKLAGLILVFLFIKTERDINLLAFIYGMQMLLCSFISLLLGIKKFGIKINIPSKKEILVLVRGTREYFISRFFASLYTTLCIVYLGLFSSSTQVALYGAAEQLYKAGQQVFSPFTQAVYPYMVRTRNYSVFYKILAICFFIAITGSTMGLFAGEVILNIIFGDDFSNAKDVLNIFMLTILISSMSMMIGYPALAPLGFSRKVNISVVLGGVVQLFILIGITLFFDNKTAYMMALSILTAEIFVFSFRGYYFLKKVVLP